MAINSFKPLERVQQFQADLSHLVGVWPELLRVLDGEPDSIHPNARLVTYLELHCRWPGL